MFAGLLKMSGFLILMLIYGKKNKQKVNKIVEDFFFIPLALSFAFIMWFICLMLAGIDSGDQIGCIIYGITFPAALVVWAIIVRRKPRKDCADEEDEQENKTDTESTDADRIHTLQNHLDSLMTTPSQKEPQQNDPIPEVEQTEQTEEESDVHTDIDEPSETDRDAISSQLQEEQHKYLALKEKIDKIPVERVKQWYNDGTITEEQYRTIVRKYNSIVREMKDIKDRLSLLKSLHDGEFDE